MAHLISRNPLTAYFAIAFGLTWLLQIPALLLAYANDQPIGNEDNLRNLFDLVRGRLTGGELTPYLLFLLGAGPVISAVVVLGATQGREGIRDLLRRMANWRIPARWYVIALALPLGLAGVSLLAGVVVGGVDLRSYDPLLPASYAIPFFIYLLLVTGLYEEPGWRGFALPYLQRDNTAIKASWILGIAWAAWHFPILIYYNLVVTEVAPPVLVPILAGAVMGTVGWTIVNTWIYNSTQSIFLMIVLHGWYNTVTSYVVLPFENMVMSTVSAVLPWAVAIVVSKKYGDEQLTEGKRPTLRLEAAT